MADNMRQGPATFAIDADQAVQAAALPAQAGPNAQAAPISPGLSVGAVAASDVNTRTFKAITDLASGILAPKIKEAAQEQFIGGVQRAMTGEALGEIIKDQPWYTDIFAPSSALAGARAYTSNMALSQWAGKMQEQMPNLAKQGPESLRSAAVGAMQGFLTGDAGADSLITAGVVEHMAPLFKQHAKEHYVFMQKQASEAQIGAWEAGAKVLQGFTANSNDTLTPEDKAAAKSRFLGSVVPFADQSDESYERNIKAFLEGSASQGNFQVVRLFKESGLYDKINPDKRAELDRSLGAFGRKALDKAMPQFAMPIALLLNDMTQNPAGIVEKVQALNAKAAEVTGVTEAELIPSSQLDNVIGRVLTAQEHARQAALKQVPAPDVGVAMAEALMFTVPGGVDQAVKLGLIKETDVERAGLKYWNAAGTPADKAKVLNARTLSAFDVVKSQFVNTLRADEYNAGIGQMIQTYASLADNVRPLYFDEHQRSLMDRVSAQVRAGMPEDAAWATAKVNASAANYLIPESAKDEVSKAIRSHVESKNENMVGWNTVDDAALRTIEAVTMKAYKADRTNNPVDVAVKRAYAQARANGLDVQGKHAIINVRPSDRPLFAVVGEGERATAEAFESLMAEKAKALGAKLDNYEAVRVPDAKGAAYIYVNATDDEGKTFSWSISSPELKARVTDAVGKELGQRRPTGTPTDLVPPVLDPLGLTK